MAVIDILVNFFRSILIQESLDLHIENDIKKWLSVPQCEVYVFYGLLVSMVSLY